MIHTHICLHVTTTYAERNFSSIRKLLKKIQVRVCVCVFSINARVLISFCSNGWVLRIKNGKGFFVLLGRCSWWAGLAQRFESWAAAQDWRWAGQERQGRAHAEVPGEGCKVDLSDAKAYYSRHRICGVHSKSPKVIVAGIEQRFCQQCSRFHQLAEFDQGKRSCRIHLAGHNERRRKPPQECKNLRPSFIDNNHISKSGGFAMDFSPYPSFLTRRELSPDSASERGLTTNRAAITGKYEFPWQSNSPQNPLCDLLTCRPSYSASPVASSQECFNGVSDSSNALSLLSNNPWAGPKSRLGVNGQPSYDNPGSAIGDFVCSPWNFKGNGDVGLGEASQPGNGGLELGQQNVVHFGQLDQTREFQI